MLARAARTIAILSILLVTLGSVHVIGTRMLEREADAANLRLVGVRAGPPGGESGAGMRVTMVVEAAGSAVLARVAGGLVLDVAVEGFALGRVTATPDGGGLVEGPARFRVEATASALPDEASRTLRERAFRNGDGMVLVQATGRLLMPLGIEKSVSVECLAPLDPPRVSDAGSAFTARDPDVSHGRSGNVADTGFAAAEPSNAPPDGRHGGVCPLVIE